MSDKRAALEKKLEAITTRIQVKTAQLSESRAALKAVIEDLANENNVTKWEAAANEHNLANIRIAALVDEIALLETRQQAARAEINAYELALVQAEISQLVTENQGIRTKAETLRNEFRVLASRPSSDIEAKRRIAEVKNELAQLGIAGELTNRQIEQAKRRRESLTSELEAVN